MPAARVRGMLAMSKLAALAAGGDSLSSAAALKADALRIRDCRLAMMAVQASLLPRTVQYRTCRDARHAGWYGRKPLASSCITVGMLKPAVYTAGLPVNSICLS